MSVKILQGDVREVLKTIPSNHFDCVVSSPPYFGLRSYLSDSHPDKHLEIGLEATLGAYLETMVAVCRELRRVLKPSGVFFLNCGDSYAANRSYQISQTKHKSHDFGSSNAIRCPYGLKPKDLCLVPERLGIALQADGWWVRSHIIWAKKNCMPESVTDRPTSAHETIWLLTKSARYFWDGEAVKEDASTFERQRSFGKSPKTIALEEDGTHGEGGNLGIRYDRQARNIRNVWSISSHPFSQAHFATMPPEIAERCIKAGSSERGCCPACGAPWVRVVEHSKFEQHSIKTKPQTLEGMGRNDGDRNLGGQQFNKFKRENPNKLLGWQPSCKCRISGLIDCMPYTPIPSRILDPFAGAGTTGLVSDRLGRDCTLIDLNTSYIDMAVNRIRDDAPLFAEVAAE